MDKYPALLTELMRRGWTDADVAQVAGGNVLRVMAETERIARQLRDRPPSGVIFRPDDEPGQPARP